MVAAGNRAARSGPGEPLSAAVGLFVVGLLVAGTATLMPFFILGRLIQGLRGGAITVALYVVVAKAYTPELHSKVFAAFAAAWVVPSFVGPFLTGLVAQSVGWRWVFLGVVDLVVPALVLVAPALQGLSRRPRALAPARQNYRRFLWASLAALSILALRSPWRVSSGPARGTSSHRNGSTLSTVWRGDPIRGQPATE
jgi:MFS family permease